MVITDNPGDLVGAARALGEGGIKLIEITMTIPGALKIIEAAAAELKHDDVYIGAGTVLDAENARAVILAGAKFAVAPIFNPPMVTLCNRYSVAVMPGACTPQEIFNAWQWGIGRGQSLPGEYGRAGVHQVNQRAAAAD